MAIGPVMLDLEGLELSSEERDLLCNPAVGGVIYFSRNYASVAQITELTQSIREVRPELLLAVDHEGGRVQRFREGFTKIPAMQQFLPLYRKKPEAALTLVEDCAWLMASELLAIGIDFSFAPVLDVDDHHCEVIGNRSFSPNPVEVIALGEAWMKGMHSAGMATTGKHFPGHGSVIEDSHLDLPVDKRSFSEIAEHDLLPFAALSKQMDAVMPAHILFPDVDSQQPVGFSSYWLKTILREDLTYDGVIFSDDLSMVGAQKAGTYLQRAELALSAGCDMVLICNQPEAAADVVSNLEIVLSESSINRLEKMKARTSVNDLVDLKSQLRWQKTQQFLGMLV